MKTIIFIIIVVIIISNVLKALWNQMQGTGSASPLPRKRGKRSLIDVLSAQKRNQAWMDSAFDFELEYIRPDQNGYPSLRGIREDRTIEVEVEEADSGYRTQCTVYFKDPFQFGIHLFRDHANQPNKVVCSSLHEFMLCGLEADPKNSEMLESLLNDKRRKILSDALNRYPFLELADDFVSLKTDGAMEKTDEINFLIEYTLSTAKALEDPEHSTFIPPVRKLSKLVIPPVQKQEILKRTETQKTHLPESKPVAPAAELEKKPTVQQKKTIPVPAEPEKISDAQKFAEKLFSASFPGAAEQAFFQSVKGSAVEWEGKLLSAYRFGSDYVLGSGPAVKAVFETAEISGAYSMKSRIKAVVRLPEESMESLKNQNGKVFRFSGKLEKFEPYAKELILLDGSLK